jgi:tripartite-type tricarboxylate transporter receptor subunit TctC
MTRLALSFLLSILSGIAAAQGYPTRSVTLITPFPPGGSTDAVARVLADRMRAPLGQNVIVENVGGAGGSIALGRVARATPDGYTIDIGQWDTHVGNGVVYNINYDLQKDFEPIGLVSMNPQLVVGRKGLPAEDLKGLIAWMKANPGKATVVNQNAAAQTAGILMKQITGVEFLFVPYRGAGPAMQDMLAGNVDLLMVQAAAVLAQVRAGTLKAYAQLAPQRSAALPDIPTADEGGVPGWHMPGWFGLFAPKGTPREAIVKLNAAMKDALADANTQKRLTDLGLDVAAKDQQTPEALAAFNKAEIEKWWPIMKAAGIKPE